MAWSYHYHRADSNDLSKESEIFTKGIDYWCEDMIIWGRELGCKGYQVSGISSFLRLRSVSEPANVQFLKSLLVLFLHKLWFYFDVMTYDLMKYLEDRSWSYFISDDSWHLSPSTSCLINKWPLVLTPPNESSSNLAVRFLYYVLLQTKYFQYFPRPSSDLSLNSKSPFLLFQSLIWSCWDKCRKIWENSMKKAIYSEEITVDCEPFFYFRTNYEESI